MLNNSSMGFGFDFDVRDKATPVLNNFANMAAAMPGRMGGLFGMFGRLGGGAYTMAGNMESAGGALGSMAAAVGPIAVAIGAATIGIMKFNEVVERNKEIILESVAAFTSYEASLAEVTTIIQGTDQEMAKLGDTALRMSASFGRDTTETLKGFYQTASAGFANAADAATVMDTANKLAVAGITDTFTAVDLLTTVLNGYSIQAQDAAGVSDTLFQAVKFGKTTVGELAAAMGQVVPSAAAAGATIDETAAAMATLTLAGQSTRMSSVAMARAFDFLVKLPPKAASEMEKLGVDLDKLNVRTNGLQNVLLELNKVFGENEEALARIGLPIRAFRALMPLATSMSSKFGEVLAGMGDKAGSADEAFETMSNTLGFQIQRWQAFGQVLKVQLGAAFAPILKLVMDPLMRIMDVLMNLPEPLRRAAFFFAALGLAIPVVVAALGGFLLAGAVAFVLISGLVGILVTLLIPMAAVAAAFAPLVAGAGALYLAWRTNFLGIADTVVLMWEKVKLTFRAVKEFIEGGGVISGPLAEELAKAENAKVLKFAGLIYSAFVRIKEAGVAAWEAVKESLDAVAPVVAELFPSIKPFVEALVGGGDASTDLERKLPVEKFREFGRTVGNVIGAVIRVSVGIADFWKTELQPLASAFMDVFVDAWPVIKTVLQGVGWALSNVVLPALKAMVDLLVAAYEAGKALGEVLKPIIDFVAVPVPGTEAAAAQPQTSMLERLVGQPTLAVPPPAAPTKGGGAGGGPGQPIVVNLNSKMDLDGKKVGESVQQFVIRQQEAEMVTTS